MLTDAPQFDTQQAGRIAREVFGIEGDALMLPSERDQNFLLASNGGEKFVLKIANRNEKREVLEAQNAMLGHLEQRVSFCPRVVPGVSGETIVIATLGGCAKRLVRVVRHLEGVPLAKVEVQSQELLYDLGRKLGQLSAALVEFDHPGAHRAFHWDLAQGVQVVRQFGPRINTDWIRDLVLGFKVDCDLGKLRRSVIHGDANDYNVLVEPESNKVVGLIDFGDIVYSYTVGDLAIAVAYVVLGKKDPFAAAAPVIEGYREQFPLTKDELDALWRLVRLRLCMSVAIAAYQQEQQPNNEYLGISQQLIAETLPRLMNS